MKGTCHPARGGGRARVEPRASISPGRTLNDRSGARAIALSGAPSGEDHAPPASALTACAILSWCRSRFLFVLADRTAAAVGVVPYSNSIILFHFGPAEIADVSRKHPGLPMDIEVQRIFKDTFDGPETLGKFENQRSIKVTISER